jgi:hypothetical protein
VSEIADQVCDRMIIASPAVLLENRDGLGGPGDMVGFVGHAQPPRGFANWAGRRQSQMLRDNRASGDRERGR